MNNMIVDDSLCERVSRKILTVSASYGISQRTIGLVDDPNRDINFEAEIVGIFKAAGYDISRSGSFSGCPGEIGIWADQRLAINRLRTQRISEVVGVPVPREIDISCPVDVLQFPIIVKNTARHRGKGKYIVRNVTDLEFWKREIAERNALAAFKAVNAFTSQDPAPWIMQEFIQCPSDRFTSCRVVVDAFGNIHSAALLYSTFTKDALTDGVVSNVANGGKQILLNGQPVVENVPRNILIAHAIDPTNPQIPADVAHFSRLIGKASCGIAPYVGSDYVFRQDVSPVLSEVNVGPNISPESIGLSVPSGLNDEDISKFCIREMMRRVAAG